MARAYNFAPGPAALPESVLKQAQADMLEWGDAGASIVEMSHRGPEFMAVATRAEADLRTLLDVPDDYAVLFLPGGATTAQALARLVESRLGTVRPSPSTLDHAPVRGLHLRLLGRVEGWLDGTRLLLTRRQSEILALLVLHRSG